MLDLEVFDSVRNYSTELIGQEAVDGNLELAGTALLTILLFVTTGFHPWLVVPNLLVQYVSAFSISNE